MPYSTAFRPRPHARSYGIRDRVTGDTDYRATSASPFGVHHTMNARAETMTEDKPQTIEDEKPLDFKQLSPSARTLWAKSGLISCHSLLAHMLDVAAVCEAILRRESDQNLDWIARTLGLPRDQALRWVSALVGLHDFGKAVPGFQFKWPDGQRALAATGLAFRQSALSVHRHDLAGAALLRRLLPSRVGNDGWLLPVTMALAAHHGYMPGSRELKDAMPRHEGPGWQEVRTEVLDAYLQTLQPFDEPAVANIDLPVVVWLAGLTSVADWIGSNQEWFPLGERAETLVEHFEDAGRLAENALDAIGWPEFRVLLTTDADTDTLVSRMLGRSSDSIVARPLQTLADRLLQQADGPTLMIVEAPMGEGKTELAMLAHLRLQAANGHRGLYVALPTQATGNAMFDRALTFLRSFAPDIRLDIQLAQGGSMLDERIHRLRGVDASDAESVASSAWFSERKRPLLSPYGVGTVDQALFATLNVKHHFVRLWGLANRVVVLDEIHAYDTYTTTLIEALLRWLKAMGCSVVLMSATLPTSRREALLNAWGAQDGDDIPYPRVLMTKGNETLGQHIPSRPLGPVHVSGIDESLDTIATTAIDCLAQRGCGVVILNTVQRAQDLYRMLRDRIHHADELMLFHARFPADERGQRERMILERFGRDKPDSRPKRALLIATQVVEQSLDLDFDFMLSDLAPIDLLLQRSGRLHRHQRQRPAAHEQARLVVSGLVNERPPELQDTAWGYVYDPYILFCTWKVTSGEPLWTFPGDIDRLVQMVYSQEPFQEEDRPELLALLDKALGEHYANMQEHRQRAINVAINAEDEPQNAYQDTPRADEDYTGKGPVVVTRLGQDSLTVVPVFTSEDGWRLLPGDTPFDPGELPDDGLARRIFARQLRVSRQGLVQALRGEPTPKAFDEHPLLRNLKPLLLRAGETEIGSLRISLDPELGLVYAKPATPTEGA